jgi:hypothetical protein
MSEGLDKIRPCPVCGTMGIHEAFCSVNWADMGRLYRETQERMAEQERHLADIRENGT